MKILITAFNHKDGKIVYPAWIIGKNKTLGALVEFASTNRQWMSIESIERFCREFINWRKIPNLR